MIALLLLLAASIGVVAPDPALTPGVINPAITKALACSTKWGKDHRAVTEAMKQQIAAAYGIPRARIVGRGKGPCCEYDHKIPRENGGADDVKNIYPQLWAAAVKKDHLENVTHQLLCKGMITLAESQQAFQDWEAAYQQYLSHP